MKPSQVFLGESCRQIRDRNRVHLSHWHDISLTTDYMWFKINPSSEWLSSSCVDRCAGVWPCGVRLIWERSSRKSLNCSLSKLHACVQVICLCHNVESYLLKGLSAWNTASLFRGDEKTVCCWTAETTQGDCARENLWSKTSQIHPAYFSDIYLAQCREAVAQTFTPATSTGSPWDKHCCVIPNVCSGCVLRSSVTCLEDIHREASRKQHRQVIERLDRLYQWLLHPMFSHYPV